jgi:hypothetical protein
MLQDSTGRELSKTPLYHIGEVETEYFFNRYVTESIALFSSQKKLTNEDPYEFVLSQTKISEIGVYPVSGSKDKTCLESVLSQSSPKCIIERS